MKTHIVLSLLLWTSACFAQYPKVESVFTIPLHDFIPEGIAYDPNTKTFYIGSLNQRKIVAITKNGKVGDFVKTGQDGLGQVLGIKVFNGSLWACTGLVDKKSTQFQGVYQFDLTNGKLIKKYKVSEDGRSHLLNDLVITQSGIVFITDTNDSSLFRVNPDSENLEKFVESGLLRYANGVTLSPDEKKLIISTGRGFLEVDINSKALSPIPFQNYYVVGLDGIYTYKESIIGIQNVTFPVSISRYDFSTKRDAIDRAEILSVNHPLFNIPTTGVIVDDWFYFIANSQLDQWDENEGKIKAPGKIKEIVIARIKFK
ncbi:MAG TPA: SMP-30/gluconolactonase/LRE family protein [Cyclobacteriaceae bacterium]